MTAPRRLLVVDDEVEIRDTLRDVLQDEGYDVLVAADGADALRVLSGERDIVLVVLDLIMPNVDGTEVYARMRADPRLVDVPVIVSTSDPSRAPAGVPVMKKPIKLDPFVGLVRTLAG
jgi:CheY-like chemotaxis protein